MIDSSCWWQYAPAVTLLGPLDSTKFEGLSKQTSLLEHDISDLICVKTTQNWLRLPRSLTLPIQTTSEYVRLLFNSWKYFWVESRHHFEVEGVSKLMVFTYCRYTGVFSRTEAITRSINAWFERYSDAFVWARNVKNWYDTSKINGDGENTTHFWQLCANLTQARQGIVHLQLQIKKYLFFG